MGLGVVTRRPGASGAPHKWRRREKRGCQGGIAEAQWECRDPLGSACWKMTSSAHTLKDPAASKGEWRPWGVLVVGYQSFLFRKREGELQLNFNVHSDFGEKLREAGGTAAEAAPYLQGEMSKECGGRIQKLGALLCVLWSLG